MDTNDIDEAVEAFIIESVENLNNVQNELLILEQNPSAQDVIESVFRSIHTIKGTCGFLGYANLGSLAHTCEALLSSLRSKKLVLNQDISDILLECVDTIKHEISVIENTGKESQSQHQGLIEKINKINDLSPEASSNSTNQAEETKKSESNSEDQPANNNLHFHASDNVIRVDVDLLDNLMNLVGELVLTRNQILQFNSTVKNNSFTTTSQRLDIITTKLQENVMKTRMQPISNLYSQYPRIVRDIAKNSNKQVQIKMEGNETEMDKTILEAIKDPLLHLVRNSVDHGIEPPDVRKSIGKNEDGLVYLRAYHEGGQVVIEISDDGAGINPDVVLQTAISKGFVTQEQATRLSEKEILELIFVPGLSTTEHVTNVSGRGVGMDVVKTNVEKINGNIDIQSKLGKGTSFRIKIPLTLAIIPALLVSSGGERYAIPQISLVELVRLESEQSKKSLETVEGVPIYKLRGKLLPLIYLSQELDIPQTNTEKHANTDEVINIVVLQSDNQQFGLVVDLIHDTEEIVVKPLSKQIRGIKIFAGATILGDGKVSLILDVLGLAQNCRVISEQKRNMAMEKMAQKINGTNVSNEIQTLLLLRTGKDHHLAVDLSSVSRLEEFSSEKIERVSGIEVIKYRGEIIPLIRVANYFDGFSDQGSVKKNLQVVVYSTQNGDVGLIVDSILDIIEGNFVVHPYKGKTGLVGSTIVQDHVMDLLNVEELISASNLDFFFA
ncbi:MAG: chemotaxis protein CheW [Leptospiraceae bacterium]|nr:chemotaxis protein CheW [Leptospiraceae bacterium]MCP5493662.1 chemotaxis protein CheW [Leptospiraceae bacterium]